jgi:hypothetical protein
VLEGVRDELVGDHPDLLRDCGVEVDRIGFDDGSGVDGPSDGSQDRPCPHGSAAGLGEQPVHRGDAADADGGVVERAPAFALRAGEQEEIGDRLEAVLDAVVGLGEKAVLELRASSRARPRRSLALSGA